MKNVKKRLITAGVLTLLVPTYGIAYLCGTKNADKYLDTEDENSISTFGAITLQTDTAIEAIGEYIDNKRYDRLERKYIRHLNKMDKLCDKMLKMKKGE